MRIEMMKRAALALLLGLTAALPAGHALGSGDALDPPSTGGLEAVDRLLAKLATHRRLLVIGAHPDDEDTSLLALVSRGMGGEAAYLSLSRGDGGQNLLGPDLGVALGLIRSQELVAARRTDGARQYFTRAFDFGFTRSIDETQKLWPKEILVEDAVRVIRRFRPQVIVSTFSGTARDGHGQHQAAGLTAREAFALAGDPKPLPQLQQEGLTPWAPKALYRSTYFDREATTLHLPTGDVDPLTGRSYYQIAMASRSHHRSQDMGMLQPPGPSETRVAWVAGGVGAGARELFDGTETRLSGIAGEVADAGRRSAMEAALDRVEKLAQDTRRKLTPASLAASAAPIAEIVKQLRAIREGASPSPTAGGPGAVGAAPAAARPTSDLPGGVTMLLNEKIAAAEQALAAAAGVALEAYTDREVAPPGEGFAASVFVWNAGASPVAVGSVTLVSPDGWTAGGPPATAREVAAGTLADWKLSVTIPPNAPPTLPYFLRRPMQGALYDWSAAPAAVRGEPFQPPPLSAHATATIAGVAVTLEREVVYRFRDQAIGEIRRPIRCGPAVDVALEPDLMVWPMAQTKPRHIEVTLTSNSDAPQKGRLEVGSPAGWPAVAPLPFVLGKRGEHAFFEVRVQPPKKIPAGREAFKVAAVLENGRREEFSIRILEYPHIPPTPMPQPAEVSLVAADIRLPNVRRVGYVRGASDRVPEYLSAIGVPVDVLSRRDLDTADLARYDAILIGSRAYESDPELPKANGRLLDYARAGGLVVVQYQQYPFVEGKFAPFPLEIARPHDRVTDETAKVTLLEPSHQVFQHPNRIGDGDWDGWVQERGLYFAHTWDKPWTPLLSMADPGGPEQRGGLLVAQVGKGHYIYTGLAFFRQLPAGVPGAYRLLANLIGWKSDSQADLHYTEDSALVPK
jgi:LmbE family N-acetylglucosaminyl deacetylase